MIEQLVINLLMLILGSFIGITWERYRKSEEAKQWKKENKIKNKILIIGIGDF